ncbi:hypothetical protein J3A64_001860 [Pseudarthrobacter sp. PvP004]|uniref:hypothetical protein n=1 Tax=Pseudarthrobacter sp. PvP004 TaxID=2817850 RepID=UPI001AE80238|nr:hypothetical protein [Pseudarthrobacter sp. PvP004]MBP2266396.1 hypothetical protein [Pseudarthrobacter sp. PvP004]
MTRILFVHGTGVRRKAFDHVFSKFRTGLESVRPSYLADPCLWGEAEGTSLLAAGASIPKPWRHQRSSPQLDGSKGTPSGATDEAADAIWAILEVNPLAELEEMAKSSGRIQFEPLGRTDVETALRSAVTTNARVTAALKNADLEYAAIDSVEALLRKPVCYRFLANPYVDNVEKMAPLSRALIAVSLNNLDEQLGTKASIDGSHRDELVAALIDALGGNYRGMGTAILGNAARMLLDLGLLSPLENRRTALVPKAAPAMGDVLKYLARGEGLRSHLRARISESKEDVVILAHSLGGIAAVDLLVEDQFSQVRGLVTVGTQVGLLYELNALPSLEFGQQLPASFPRWDNVLDPRDHLAYSSQGVFPGLCTDHPVDNASPFPRNHSAYFGNPKFYTILDGILP